MENTKKRMEKNRKDGKGSTGNRKIRDSGSKLIFGNPELCSQLLRGYTDIPQLRDVKAEDIEDVSERYVHMFAEERSADTVKRVRLSDKESMFLVSLIEHKSYVDYNVIMQVLRYMVCIWEDYEKEMERQHKGISKTKNFKYPPILPIIYYEGKAPWTAAEHLRDRVLMSDVFAPYLPDFSYKLIQLNEYSQKELTEKKDDLSLVMLVNQIQGIEDFGRLDLPEEYLKNLSENTPEYIKDILVKVTGGLLRHLKIPEQDIINFTEQIKEEKRMGELFENFKDFDFPAAKKKAIEEGLAAGLAAGRAEGLAAGREEGLAAGREEGLVAGRAEGHEQGLVEGRKKGLEEGKKAGVQRVNRLIQLLLEQSREAEISRAVSDFQYQEQLFAEFHL